MNQNHAQAAGDMYYQCMQLMHRYVLVETNDGHTYDGIVEHVDSRQVYLAVPDGMCAHRSRPVQAHMQRDEEIVHDTQVLNPTGNQTDRSSACTYEQEDERQIGGWGYPSYGSPRPGHPGHGYPGHWHPGYGPRPRPRPHPYRPRRFRRVVLPLAVLTALSLLPYY